MFVTTSLYKVLYLCRVHVTFTIVITCIFTWYNMLILERRETQGKTLEAQGRSTTGNPLTLNATHQT